MAEKDHQQRSSTKEARISCVAYREVMQQYSNDQHRQIQSA